MEPAQEENLSHEELELVSALLDRKTAQQQQKAFQCKVCGLVCSSAQQLGGHQNSHRNQFANAAKVDSLGTESNRPSRKRKVRAPERNDFEYGDLDEIIAGEEDHDLSGGGGGGARSSGGRSGPMGTTLPGTLPRREGSPSLSGRTRPTNNQLLYKAFFRWEHYPHAVEDESMLEVETKPCASVTSAFLQILLAVYNAECQRREAPRNILQLLAAHTRRTKVVEMATGGARISEDLRRHTLVDEDGLHYSTNLDRNRYGADDNYLFTVVRHNLQFLGLCPALVDVAIIDAKSKGKTRVAVVPPGGCTCRGEIGRLHRAQAQAQAAAAGRPLTAAGGARVTGVSTSPNSSAPGTFLGLGGLPDAETPRSHMAVAGLPLPPTLSFLPGNGGPPVPLIAIPTTESGGLALPPNKRLRPTLPLPVLAPPLGPEQLSNAARSRLGRALGGTEDDAQSIEEGMNLSLGGMGPAPLMTLPLNALPLANVKLPLTGPLPTGTLDEAQELRRRVMALEKERDEERGLRRRAERELLSAQDGLKSLQAALTQSAPQPVSGVTVGGPAPSSVDGGAAPTPTTSTAAVNGASSLQRLMQQANLNMNMNLMAASLLGVQGLNLMAPAAASLLAANGLLLPQGNAHALTSIFQQAAAIGAQAGLSANQYLQGREREKAAAAAAAQMTGTQAQPAPVAAAAATVVAAPSPSPPEPSAPPAVALPKRRGDLVLHTPSGSVPTPLVGGGDLKRAGAFQAVVGFNNGSDSRTVGLPGSSGGNNSASSGDDDNAINYFPSSLVASTRMVHPLEAAPAPTPLA